MFNRFKKDTILVSLFFSNGWTMKSDAYKYQVSKKTLDKDIIKELTEKYNGKWHVTSIARNDNEIYNRFKLRDSQKKDICECEHPEVDNDDKPLPTCKDCLKPMM